MSVYSDDSPRRPSAKEMSPERLFWNGMHYHSVSQSLNEIVLEKSHGELCPLRSSCTSMALNSSTAMNSMIDQHFLEESSHKIHSQQQLVSPSKPLSALEELIQSNLQETESCVTKSVQAIRLESNLSLYHKEAFSFLMKMNSNQDVLREEEAHRRIRRELNLDDTISCSSFQRPSVISKPRNQQLYSSMTFPLEITRKLDLSILQRIPTFVNEKQHTVQTILAATFCRTFSLPHKLRTLKPQRKQVKFLLDVKNNCQED